MNSTRSPIEVVQAQLEAYNRRDLEGFLATFSDDATVFDLGVPAPIIVGKQAIRERYRDLFGRSPTLHCTIVTRAALGRAVVDLEHITGRNGAPDPFEVMAIYEVNNGYIARLHFVRNEGYLS
jgi:hypothetical protein